MTMPVKFTTNWYFRNQIISMYIEKCSTDLTRLPDGKRKVGRPLTTWSRTIEQERS